MQCVIPVADKDVRCSRCMLRFSGERRPRSGHEARGSGYIVLHVSFVLAWKTRGKIAPACRKMECFSLSRPWRKSHYTNRELTFSNLSLIPPQQIATVSAIPAKTPASNVSVFAAALFVFSLSSLEVGFSIQKGKNDVETNSLYVRELFRCYATFESKHAKN